MRCFGWVGLGALALLFSTSVQAAQPGEAARASVGEPASPAVPPSAPKAVDGATSVAVEPQQGAGVTGSLQAGPEPTDKVAALAPVAPVRAERPPPPPVTLTATIDLTHQRMMISERGRVLYTWKISSGRQGYRTPTGKFRPQWRSRMWYSRQYDLSPMPYAVFFNGGIATHGTSAVGRLGRPASHGCIRLTSANAKTFYTLVGKHGNLSTRIVVTGTAPGTDRRLATGSKRGSTVKQDRRRVAHGPASNSSRSIQYRHTQGQSRGGRFVQTPHGYKIYYSGPTRVSRYSQW